MKCSHCVKENATKYYREGNLFRVICSKCIFWKRFASDLPVGSLKRLRRVKV